MKIFISAYACEPGKGSEPEAGWEWVAAARRNFDSVTVLTRDNNRSSIEAVLGDSQGFVFHDLGRIWLWAKRRLPFGTQLYYLLWQLSSRRMVRSLHSAHGFDVCHHLTFAVDWMPVNCEIDNTALVWGPVGGATGLPWRLWRSQGMAGLRRELAREVSSRLLRRIFGYRVARKASVVIAQNHDEVRMLGEHVNGRLILEPNVVVDPSLGQQALTDFIVPAAEGIRTAVFVGRLIPHKGLRFAIEALSLPLASDWRLVVIGTGPETKRSMELAQQLGVSDRVTFVGKLDRNQVGAALRVVDAMVAPSMYEGSGFAVAEAVTLGCPVVATDRGGPAVMVPEEAGRLVPADRHLASHIAEALRTLGPRAGTNSRWTRDRLDDLLRDAYTKPTTPVINAGGVTVESPLGGAS